MFFKRIGTQAQRDQEVKRTLSESEKRILPDSLTQICLGYSANDEAIEMLRSRGPDQLYDLCSDPANIEIMRWIVMDPQLSSSLITEMKRIKDESLERVFSPQGGYH